MVIEQVLRLVLVQLVLLRMEILLVINVRLGVPHVTSYQLALLAKEIESINLTALAQLENMMMVFPQCASLVQLSVLLVILTVVSHVLSTGY